MITFVNALRVPVERDEEFVTKWDRGAEYVRSQPGLVWTSLHRAVRPGAPFRYFTIAVWESREAFATATSTSWWRSYVADFGISDERSGFGVTPTVSDVVRSGGPFV